MTSYGRCGDECVRREAVLLLAEAVRRVHSITVGTTVCKQAVVAQA